MERGRSRSPRTQPEKENTMIAAFALAIVGLAVLGTLHIVAATH
jgi:hypothetical protein